MLGDTGVRLDSLIKVAVGATALIMASVPGDEYNYRHDPDDLNLEDLPARYNPEQLADYFGTRPVCVLRRQSQVASKLSALLVAVLSDWRSDRWERNMPQRATWLRHVLEQLGPAYVKIGQALSTRIDIFPEPYLEQLRKLQVRNLACGMPDTQRQLSRSAKHKRLVAGCGASVLLERSTCSD